MQEDQRTQSEKFEELSRELECQDEDKGDALLRQTIRKIAHAPKVAPRKDDPS